MRAGSAATAIGIGIHSAIEEVLKTCSSSEDICQSTMEQSALAHVHKELESINKPSKLTDDPDELALSVSAMVNGFVTSIAPSVQFGGMVEHKFQVPSGVVALNGYEIWYEGTIDYVDPDGLIWDWKTSGKTYYGIEKQRNAVQPSVYSYWAKMSGRSQDVVQPFNYGVMVRTTGKGQVVRITRGKPHYDWLNRVTVAAVNSGLVSGAEWLMNDQSALCSSEWCDFWSICKGAHVTN